MAQSATHLLGKKLIAARHIVSSTVFNYLRRAKRGANSFIEYNTHIADEIGLGFRFEYTELLVELLTVNF